MLYKFFFHQAYLCCWWIENLLLDCLNLVQLPFQLFLLLLVPSLSLAERTLKRWEFLFHV
jgi:hypothetical protein